MVLFLLLLVSCLVCVFFLFPSISSPVGAVGVSTGAVGVAVSWCCGSIYWCCGRLLSVDAVYLLVLWGVAVC